MAYTSMTMYILRIKMRIEMRIRKRDTDKRSDRYPDDVLKSGHVHCLFIGL